MQLLHYPDEGLRQDCAAIDPTAVSTKFIDNMITIMNQNKGNVLSAPQIGENKKIFIIKKNNIIMIFINCVITAMCGWIDNPEYCISLQNEKNAIIKRRYAITARFQDVNGAYHSKQFKGGVASLIQQGVDYTNGILIIDRINHE